MKIMLDINFNREILYLEWKGRDFKIPKLLNNRFEVESILAVGGMGVIFVAKDKRLFNKKVLIKRSLYRDSLFQNRNDKNRWEDIKHIRKTMDTEYAAMLHGWGRKIPNIPIPLDKFEDLNPEIYGPHTDKSGNKFFGEKELYETEPYLVINYFTGKPIKKDHPEVNKNVVDFAYYYLRNVANILKRFHQKYISNKTSFEFFYCDLKPDNVLLTKEKQLVLIDMGSFAIRVNGKLVNDITTTPGYCAPELKNNQGMYLSPAVDVYTLAISVFELITEQSPQLDQFGNIELNWKKFNEITVKAKQESWTKIFKKALEEDPQKRFQNMDELLSAFKKNIPIQNNSEPPINTNYFRKKLVKPKLITSEWKTQQGSYFSGNIFNFPIWKSERFFEIKSQATKIKNNLQLDAMHESLLHELFEKSKINLIENLTYLPELLEITSQNTYVNYVPELLKNKDKLKEYVIKSNIKKNLYLFMNLEMKKMSLIGISPKTLKTDILGNPFINEFWLLLNKQTHHFLENPLIQKVVGNSVILPPELKKDRIWIEERSFSYLAGINALLLINSEKTLELYYNNKLYEKIHYERFVRTLGITNELKEIILNLINPIANLRLTPYEAISKMKGDETNIVKREVSQNNPKGIQIQYTESLYGYQFQYREIGNITNKAIFWKNVTKHIILHQKPSDFFERILQRNRTAFQISNKQNVSNKIFTLLEKSVKDKQIAILIIDKSINNMEDKLTEVLKKFTKVILFSEKNPFNLSNIEHHTLSNFTIKRRK